MERSLRQSKTTPWRPTRGCRKITPGPPSARTSDAHTAITGAANRSMSSAGATTSNARFTPQDNPSRFGVRMRVTGIEPMWSPAPVCVAKWCIRGTTSRSHRLVCGVRTASSSLRSEKPLSVTSSTSARSRVTQRSRSSSPPSRGRTTLAMPPASSST